ncbi:MAG: hypothetical protein HY765_10145 [Rhodomicrobium sp.]|nr:hypothetical protein [Rhodomicrobium sp.]
MISMPLSRRLSLLGLAAGAAFPALTAARAAPASWSGPVLLTVGGLVGTPNRSAFDPKRDLLFDRNNLSFQEARAFSAGELAGFPQQAVAANIYGSDALSKGPRLHDVLAAASPLAAAKTARLSALDGYAAEIALADVQSQQWILAMESDGKAFAIGDFGPLFSMRQLGRDEEKTGDEAAKWVHSIYYIELMA